MVAKLVTKDELLSQIGEWNRRYPVGTEVYTHLYPDRVLKTRTEARILFNQKAVIYLEGFKGYFDLHEVFPAGRNTDEGEQAQGGEPSVASAAISSHPTAVNESPKKRITVLFPGQGAQYKGMGKNLFPLFPELTRRVDEILGYSIESLCVEDSYKQLNLTQYTQVALYVVNAFSHMERKRQNDPSVEADFLMGHSLGEFNALLAADAFDFDSGLRMVVKRATLMGAASGGTMAAVLGVGPDRIRKTFAEHRIYTIDIANYNTPTQTVVSGSIEAMKRATEVLSGENIQTVPLSVSGAFHSRHMREAQQTFAEYVKTFSFRNPKLPVIANATARPYTQDCLARTLTDQITNPVLWTDSIRYVLRQAQVEFTEIGSSILTKMVKEIAGADASANPGNLS